MHNLSDEERQELLKNPNVEKITQKFVIYSAKFKLKAVEDYISGKSPDEIFTNSKIPIKFFENDYPRFCIKRWKKKYVEEGEDAFKEDLRGKSSSGRPKKLKTKGLTYEELEAIIEIQQGVIEELKKLRALAKKKY